MNIIDKIKEMVKASASKIEIKDQISGLNYVDINIVNFNQQPISLGVIPNDLKIRVQPIGSDANGFFHQDGRIDNCHGTIHQHSGGSIYPIENNTLSGALSIILGNEDCWSLESNDSS